MKNRLGFALAAVLAAGSAEAGTPVVPPAAPTPALVPVQYRDADVFYDERGNQILMDRQTGEIISVRPAARRPLRRLYPQDDGTVIEGPLRPMRRRDWQQQDDGGYQDDANAFPPAPTDPDYRAPAPAEPRPRTTTVPPRTPIERKPLTTPVPAVPSQAAPAQTAPAQTAEPAAPRSTDEPTFTQPKTAAVDLAAPAATDTATVPTDTTGTVEASTDPAVTTTATADPATDAGPTKVAPGLSGGGVREDVAALQILLDRGGSSPGVIDGRFGSNVDRAIVAYRRITGKNLKSTDTIGIRQALAETGGDPFMDYTLTAEDVAGPYVASVPEDYSQKAKLDRLSYTSVTEALGERFHMDEGYLKALNPDANFNRVGTVIKVANVGQNVTAKVARITADKKNTQVLAYDAYDKLVAAYPASIGSSDTPSPVGTHEVSRIAFNPEYTYNPKINFQQGANDKVLTIPPGPNGPVGSIWIALDKPTYGVHGTPEPSKIGKTQSHGCVRLTNWDAAELAKMVSAGVTVEFLE